MSGQNTILLVDDSPVFLNVYKQFLKSTRATLETARSAKEALAFCRQAPPQLIYMGYDLPDMRGADCCRTIKAQFAPKFMPIILICDQELPPGERDPVALGCDGLLAKPVNRVHFLDLGRSFLCGIREIRRACLVTVQGLHSPAAFASRGLDISSGGIFVESDVGLPRNTPLSLRIQLSKPGKDGPWIECRGEVAWNNEKGNPMKPSHPIGFGVRFSSMTAAACGELADYLETLLGKG